MPGRLAASACLCARVAFSAVLVTGNGGREHRRYAEGGNLPPGDDRLLADAGNGARRLDILTRPFGATVGDFFDKPAAQGGTNVSRPIASAIIAGFIRNESSPLLRFAELEHDLIGAAADSGIEDAQFVR